MFGIRLPVRWVIECHSLYHVQQVVAVAVDAPAFAVGIVAAVVAALPIGVAVRPSPTASTGRQLLANLAVVVVGCFVVAAGPEAGQSRLVHAAVKCVAASHRPSYGNLWGGA